MRNDVEGWRVRGALVCALVVVTAACARPNSTANQTVPTPIPSPSPTPTTPLALAATAPFHTGEVGVAYAPVAMTATGGVQPYSWTISVGALPDGLTLASDGTVSGTPTAAGTVGFTVQVADAGNSTATLPASVPIAPHLSASLIAACATQCSVELGCVSVCGAFGQVGGGIGPYSYALTSGQLPSGTTLSGLTLTGTFTGLSGYLRFSVQVTDSLGATATVAPTFWMYQHISFADGTVTCFYSGCGNAYYPPAKLPYTGGIGTPTVRVISWAPTCDFPPCGPPPAPTVSAGGGLVTITVPGSSGGSGYKAVLKLLLTDGSLCAAGTYCSVAGTVSVTVQSG